MTVRFACCSVGRRNACGHRFNLRFRLRFKQHSKLHFNLRSGLRSCVAALARVCAGHVQDNIARMPSGVNRWLS